MRLVDVRHEQTAVFAAEATARLTRTPGLAVVTAGPGVTNSVSAVTTAWFNGAPVVVLAGRAPDSRWGSGSLQEMDHPPLLAPVTKRAWTEHDTARLAGSVDEAFRLAASPHRGPVFLDISLEAIYGQAEADLAAAGSGRSRAGRPRTGRRRGGSHRPIAPNGPASCARARLRRMAGRRRGRGPAGRAGAAPAGDRQRPGPRRAAARSRAAGDPGQVGGVAPGRPGHRGRDAAGLQAGVRVVRPEGRPGPGGARGRRARRDRHARPAGRLGSGRPGRVLHRAGGGRYRARFRGRRRAGGPGVGAGAGRGDPGRAGGRRAAAGQRGRSGAPGPYLRRAAQGPRRRRGGHRRRRRLRSRSPASTSSRSGRADGSIPDRSAAWAPDSATPSPPGSPARPRRSSCCSATARPASR